MRTTLTEVERIKEQKENRVFRLLLLTGVYVFLAGVGIMSFLFAITSLLVTAGSDSIAWLVLLGGIGLFAIFTALARSNFKKKDQILAN